MALPSSLSARASDHMTDSDLLQDGDYVFEKRLPGQRGRCRHWQVDARGLDLTGDLIPVNRPRPSASLPEPRLLPRERLVKATRLEIRSLRASRARTKRTKCPDPHGTVGDTLVALAKAGLSAQQLRRKLNLTLHHVLKIAKARGVAIAKRPGRTPEPLKDSSPETLKRASSAAHLAAAAEILDCTESRARTVLKEAKLPVPIYVWKPRGLSLDLAVYALEKRNGNVPRAARTLRVSICILRALLRYVLTFGSETDKARVLSLGIERRGPREGDRSRAPDDTFAERFTMLLAAARLSVAVISRRVAATLGRLPGTWHVWLRRCTAKGRRVPARADLLRVLSAGGAVDPGETTRWLMGERDEAPWQDGPPSFDVSPPDTLEVRRAEAEKERSAMVAAASSRFPTFFSRTGLSNLRRLAERLAEVREGKRSIASASTALFEIRRGRRLILSPAKFGDLLQKAGWTHGPEIASWLFGLSDDEPPAEWFRASETTATRR